MEVRVEPGAPVENRFIREINWPSGSVIATVRRHGHLSIPRGDTLLQAGDLLTVVTLSPHKAEIASLVRSNETKHDVKGH